MTLNGVKRSFYDFVIAKPIKQLTDRPTKKWLVVIYECLKNI